MLGRIFGSPACFGRSQVGNKSSLFKDFALVMSSGRHTGMKMTGVRTITKVSNDSLREVLMAKSLTSNKTFDEFLRCTIFDANGDIVVHSKDIKRLQFLKSHNLVSRDIRKISKNHINSSASYINLEVVPSIMTRKHCILLNLLNIRAMIKADQVVIFESMAHSPSSISDSSAGSTAGLNDSESHGRLLKDLQIGLSKPGEHNSLPYEFRALEVILNHLVKDLNSEMDVYTTALRNLLDTLQDSIESDKLRYLLIHAKKMTQFHTKVKLVRDSLDEVLSHDDDLNSLYLSETRYTTNHQEVELLLENYYVTCDEIVQKVANLLSQTRSTNEIINIILDSNRNEMMLLGLKFGVGLLSMGIALYVAAVYGMNLENFIEETDYGFPLVISVSFVLLLVYLLVSVKKLRKVLRITMTGKREDIPS